MCRNLSRHTAACVILYIDTVLRGSAAHCCLRGLPTIVKPPSSLLADRAELPARRAVWRALSFAVRAPRLLRLKPGVRSPELVHLLKAHNTTTAVIIGTTDPSAPVAARGAKARQKALATAIQQLRLECIPAEQAFMSDEEAAFPAYLVFGISGAQAEALLVEFGQMALLWCNQVGPPELMLHPALRQCGRDVLI